MLECWTGQQTRDSAGDCADLLRVSRADSVKSLFCVIWSAGAGDLHLHGGGGLRDSAAEPSAGQPQLAAAAGILLGCCLCGHHGAAGITPAA